MSKIRFERKHDFYVKCNVCGSVHHLTQSGELLKCKKCDSNVVVIKHKKNLQKVLVFQCKSCKDIIYIYTNQIRPSFHNCSKNIKCFDLDHIRSYRYTCKYSFKKVKDGEPESIGIIQPGKVGDIIISLPIANYYGNKGYWIIWAVCNQFKEYFNYVDYVERIIDLGYDRFHAYNKAQRLLNGYVHNIIDLGYQMWSNGPDWVSSNKSFDRCQYDEAKLSIEEKYNLIINRNREKEEELKKILRLDDHDYVVTHSQGSKGGKFNFGISNAIEIKPIDGFTLFDWIGVLENAKKIYCVDSSVANLVNQLGIAKNKRYFRPLYDVYKKSVGSKCLIPHLADDWKIVKDI